VWRGTNKKPASYVVRVRLGCEFKVGRVGDDGGLGAIRHVGQVVWAEADVEASELALRLANIDLKALSARNALRPPCFRAQLLGTCMAAAAD
jgi:hypothetical protein